MIGPIACILCLADLNICKTGIPDHNDRDTGEGHVRDEGHGERHRRRGGGGVQVITMLERGGTCDRPE